MYYRLLLIISLLALSGCVNTAVQISCLADEPIEPEPSTKKARFSLLFQYLDEKEERSVKDILVCEYKGRSCDGRGLHNEWHQQMISGATKLILKELEGNGYLEKSIASCPKLIAGQYSENGGGTLVTQDGTWQRSSRIAPPQLKKEYGIEVTQYEIKRLP